MIENHFARPVIRSEAEHHEIIMAVVVDIPRGRHLAAKLLGTRRTFENSRLHESRRRTEMHEHRTRSSTLDRMPGCADHHIIVTILIQVADSGQIGPVKRPSFGAGKHRIRVRTQGSSTTEEDVCLSPARSALTFGSDHHVIKSISIHIARTRHR